MKITYILPETSGGGIATYYKNLIPAIVNAGHEVNVILSVFKKDSKDDFPVSTLNIKEKDYEIGLQIYQSLDVFPTIRHQLALSYACNELSKQIDTDVFEITDYTLLYYTFIIHKTKPVVIRLAGSSGQVELNEFRDNDHIEYAFLLSLETTLINYADYIIGLSKLNIDFWNNRIANKAQLHLPFIHFHNEISNNPNINHITDRGIVIGRVQIWKGVVFLCEFYKRYPSFPSVDWVGGDNYFKNHRVSMLKYLSKAYPEVFNKKIFFLSNLPYAETQKKISNAAFVLVPSVWDTFNFVVAEALAKEKIVIVSTGAGASELIIKEKNGFLFNNEDIDSLKATFESYLAKSKDQIKKIQSEGLKTVQILSDSRLISGRLNIYSQIINKEIIISKDLNLLDESFINGTSMSRKIGRKLSIKDLLNIILKKIFK